MPRIGTTSPGSDESRWPPSSWNTWPDACAVITRTAMLNNVRCGGLPRRALRTDWLQPLSALTIIDTCGPRRIRAAMSTTYETDMFEPLVIANCTLKADVSDERPIRMASG